MWDFRVIKKSKSVGDIECYYNFGHDGHCLFGQIHFLIERGAFNIIDEECIFEMMMILYGMIIFG